MKVIKKAIFYSFIIFSLLFSSCENFFSSIIDIDSKENSESTEILAGSSVENGKCALTVNISQNSSVRSAYPDVSIAAWTVTANDGTNTVEFTLSGNSYLATLTAGIPWDISVLGYKEATKTTLIMAASKTVTPTGASLEVPIVAEYVSQGTGSISLSVLTTNLTDFSETNTVVLLDGTLSPASTDYSTNPTFSMKFDSVTAGVHKLSITAKDSTGLIISEYSDSSIIVLPGEETNKWYPGATDTITLLKTETFYVSGTNPKVLPAGNDSTGSGTIAAPYATITKALTHCTNTTSTYKIYTDGEFSENLNISSASGNEFLISGLGSEKSKITAATTGSVITTDTKLSLENVKITGGNATNGGGINFTGTTLTIKNCEISGNTASNGGGGIYFTNDISGDISISNTKIYGNTATYGGGIFHTALLATTSLSITANTEIYSNSASDSGGGIKFAGTTLDITNSVIGKTSTIIADNSNYSNTAAHGGGICIDGGTLTINSGAKISYNTASNGGGVYVTGTAILSATAGEISYNYSNLLLAGGAGIFIESGATVSLSGINILNNEALSSGGGIFVESGSSLEITAGSISGNIAGDDGAGILNQGTISISGIPTIAGNVLTNDTNSNLYLSKGNKVTVDGTLTSGTNKANIGITLQDSMGTFTSGYGTYQADLPSNFFTSDNTNLEVGVSGDSEASIKIPAVVLSTIYVDSIDGNDAYNGTKEYPFQTIEQALTICGTEGTYTIEIVKDITLSTTIEINGKKSIIIKNSSGTQRTITASSCNHFTISDYSTLKLEDDLVLTGGTGPLGGKLMAGSIYIFEGCFEMSGSTISGNSSAMGGAIYIEKGTFTMSGGTISSNTATDGGAIYNVGGNIIMSGGTIGGDSAGNTASSAGGAIYDGSSNASSYTGGTISYNTATVSGGAISYIGSSYISLEGTTISNNSGSNGGALFVATGTINVSTSAITSNSSTNGGALYIESGAATISSSALIDSNSATSGGAIHLRNGTLTQTGGTISNNTATSNGGGVYVYGGTYNLSGSTNTITSNTLTDGTTSNVYLSSGKVINVTDSLTGSQIGISIPIADVPYKFTSGLNWATAKNIFTADIATYEIATDSSSGEALYQGPVSSIGSSITITGPSSSVTFTTDNTTYLVGDTVTITISEQATAISAALAQNNNVLGNYTNTDNTTVCTVTIPTYLESGSYQIYVTATINSYSYSGYLDITVN